MDLDPPNSHSDPMEYFDLKSQAEERLGSYNPMQESKILHIAMKYHAL